MKDNRLGGSCAAVLVENLGAVFGGDEWHGGAFPRWSRRPTGPVLVSAMWRDVKSPPV
jgi:hypothetical protein